ncbi:MAG: cobalamin biosynthesis protein, partial [Clostridia bacterium]|nr:cobalamin biosynthesis protein [Clostridia bacterium]
MSVIVSIVIGYILDMFIGTPTIFKRGRNAFVKLLKKIYKRLNSKLAVVFTIFVIAAGGGLAYGIIKLVESYNMICSIGVESIICYFCISCRDIKDNGERVHKALKRGYIKRATKLFNKLTENGETNEPGEIAENIIIMIMDDSIEKVIAPIFYIMLFGGVGGVVYKLMVLINDASGQLFIRIIKNLADFLPARLGVVFMFVSVKILSLDFKNAFKVFMKERYKSRSLNRGLVMSLCAGALDTKLTFKKSGVVLGNGDRNVNYADIKKTFEMINIASLLTLVTL